jgi:hypothetical protein
VFSDFALCKDNETQALIFDREYFGYISVTTTDTMKIGQNLLFSPHTPYNSYKCSIHMETL